MFFQLGHENPAFETSSRIYSLLLNKRLDCAACSSLRSKGGVFQAEFFNGSWNFIWYYVIDLSTKLSLSQMLVESQARGQGSSRHLSADKVSCPCSQLPWEGDVLVLESLLSAPWARVWVWQHLQGVCAAFLWMINMNWLSAGKQAEMGDISAQKWLWGHSPANSCQGCDVTTSSLQEEFLRRKRSVWGAVPHNHGLWSHPQEMGWPWVMTQMCQSSSMSADIQGSGWATIKFWLAPMKAVTWNSDVWWMNNQMNE